MADADYVCGIPDSVGRTGRATSKRAKANLIYSQNAEEAAELKKKRTFRKFSFRGVDLDQ